MAQADRARTVQLTADEHDHLDLNASRIELAQSLTHQVDFLVKQMKFSPDEAAANVREPPGVQAEDQASDQVSWSELARLMEMDAERGERVWKRIKRHADRELSHGVRSSRTVEPPMRGRPIDRARFAVIVDALDRSLDPRDPLEHLLIHQMACAYELHLHWQERASLRAQAEEWEGDRDRQSAIRNMSPRQLERYDMDHGWMPPRVSTAEAIDQCVMIADRYQRSFLRLMKAFRDNRRLFSALIVAGGQVNIADQQIVTAEPSEKARPARSNDSRPRPIRRRAKVVGDK